ncbi:MAG: hypothetical protein NVSMB65_00570 [Chloroflexota bacterium]
MTSQDAPQQPSGADARRDIGIMLQEINQLPALIRSQVAATWQGVEEYLAYLDAAAVPRVVLTGCGDSLFVGQAARWAFERYGGVPAEAIEALDFCRYHVDSLPPGSLVVPVSYSGQVARTVEAAANALHAGAEVLAITGRPERRLGRTVPHVLTLQIPSLGYSPGTTTYIGLLVAAYLLAVGLGARRGLLPASRVRALLATLESAADLMEEAIATGSKTLETEAAYLAEADTVVFLGAGPNYASALFGAAKLFEGAEMHGVAQNTEEWAHAQYFVSDARSRTVLLAPAGRSLDRAREIGAEMRFLPTPFLVITDDADTAAWTALTPRVASLPAGLPEPFSPLLFAVPLSLLGFYLARARGKVSYNFKSPAHEHQHYETLHNSAFRDLTAPDIQEV